MPSPDYGSDKSVHPVFPRRAIRENRYPFRKAMPELPKQETEPPAPAPRSKKLSRLLRHRLSAKNRNVPTVTTHRQEKALQVETIFKDIPCRHTAQRESTESPVVTRCHDTCPVCRFSVCREAAFNGRNQVILIFIMEHSDFFTRFTPIFCPVVLLSLSHVGDTTMTGLQSPC